MRFLITFLFVYCFAAVLADIPDGLRRVKRNEETPAAASDATKRFKTELKGLAKVKTNLKKIALNDIKAEKIGLTEHDKLNNIAANSNYTTFTKNLTADIAHTVEPPTNPLKAEKKNSLGSGKLNFFWRENDEHKPQHFIGNTPMHVDKSAENYPTQHSALFTYDTPYHHGDTLPATSSKSLPDMPLLPKQRLRHFHQGMPYSLKFHNGPGRKERNKKAFGAKRKTVLVLHSPHSAKFISKEGPHKIGDNLIKEEIQQLELDTGNDFDFAEHEPKKNLQTIGGYFDLPIFPWTSSQISNFDNQFIPSKPKHMLNSMDKFMKLANIMLYKVGADGIPYHAQTTRISTSPQMFISAAATTNDNHDNTEYIETEHNFFNTDKSHLNQHKSHEHGKQVATNNNHNDDEPTAFGTLEFSPPLQLKNHPKEPKKLLNLIENALDTMLLNDGGEQKDDSDEEIEVHCPIHQASGGATKKNINHIDLLQGATVGEMDDGEHFGGMAQTKNDVIEVCQCHFIKKKKDRKH